MSSSEKIVIRPMHGADIPQVFAIEMSAHQSPWTTKIFQDCLRVGYQCLVLESKNVVEAYCILSSAVDEAHILNICVNPISQRQGYGKQLMQYVLKRVRQQQVKSIYLEVRESNLPAIGLYQKLGFHNIGNRKDYYPAPDGREDAILLRFELPK